MLSRIKLFVLIIMISFLGNNATAKYEKLAYDFVFKNLDGGTLNLAEFKKKLLLQLMQQANVASQANMKICRKYGNYIKKRTL